VTVIGIQVHGFMQEAGMPWCTVRYLSQVTEDISGRPFVLNSSLVHRASAKATYILPHVYDSRILALAYRLQNEPRESWQGRDWGGG